MKVYIRLLRYLRPYYPSLALATLCMLAFVLFNLLSLALVMPFIDTIFKPAAEQVVQAPKGGFTGISDIRNLFNYYVNSFIARYDRVLLLQVICVLIVVSFILKNAFSFLQSYFMASIEQGLMRDLRVAMYEHLHKLSLSYFSEEKKGTLISRITNDVRIANDSVMAVINSIFRDPPQIISYVLILFIFNWQLTLLVFLLVPLTGLIIGKIGDSLKRETLRSQEKLADLISVLDETLSGIRIVKAFGMEKFEIRKYMRQNNEFYKIFLRIVRRRNLASPISEVLGVLVVTVILWFMGSAILTGHSTMSPGGFIFYLGLIFQMMQPLKLFVQMFNSYKEGQAAGERLFAVLDIEPRIFDAPGAQPLAQFTSEIEFRNVRFSYDTGDEVLRGVSFTIKKGEIVAIVGPSGSGKSTLADLIPRFFDALEGTILIDGRDIRSITIESLRSHMGIVTQETILFNDSVFNNIAYGLADIPMERVIEAAKVANAHAFISDLPQGYHTNIGDRGVKLSGGERQRISIARAILKNPPLLILDEATSALDTESEILVQQALDRLMHGRTSVVIAHRLSTIQHADKILVLEDGRIRETGRHQELLERSDSLYKKLYTMQFRLT